MWKDHHHIDMNDETHTFIFKDILYREGWDAQ